MFVSRISNVINQAPFYKCLELKAEIEKLKAAQRSSQNIDPERYRLCRQEITSLRMKLHQQERHMADMQRWARLSGRGAGGGRRGGQQGGAWVCVQPSLPYEWSSSSPDHGV